MITHGESKDAVAPPRVQITHILPTFPSTVLHLLLFSFFFPDAYVSLEQVLTMIVSEYVLLEMPERFWLWYSVMVPVLLGMRYPSYVQRKWQFFYLDFCYYVQVLFLCFFLLENSLSPLKRTGSFLTRYVLSRVVLLWFASRRVVFFFFFPFNISYLMFCCAEYVMLGN